MNAQLTNEIAACVGAVLLAGSGGILRHRKRHGYWRIDVFFQAAYSGMIGLIIALILCYAVCGNEGEVGLVMGVAALAGFAGVKPDDLWRIILEKFGLAEKRKPNGNEPIPDRPSDL